MAQVGRNDPCACGSGLKFKKCCLGKEPSAPFTVTDREAALGKLADFSLRTAFDEERLKASEVFWNPWLRAHLEDAERQQAAMGLEDSVHAFALWFALDYQFADGETVLDRMLRREQARLAPGEREYLGRLRDTHLRLYQVKDVTPDVGLRLIDLWTGDPVSVRERLGSRQIVRWDLVAVRLMRGPEGDLGIEGQPYLYPVGSKDAILKTLRRLHKRFKAECGFPAADLPLFFKWVGMVFHHFWLEWVALRPPPVLFTGEGDPLIFARAIFDVRDETALLAALGRHPDLESDDAGGYSWLEDGPDFRRRLGLFVLHGKRLVIETTSEARVARGRGFLEGLAGDAVRFRVVEYEDPGRAMERVRSMSSPPSDSKGEVPADVQAQVVGEYFEKHYRRWIDEPVPALGNRTPREAAQLKRVRPKLVTLLQEFEIMSARQRLEGRPAYDFGWMWAELRLERPE